MPSKIITEQLKQQICLDYTTTKQTLNNLANKYNLSYPTISKILKNVKKYSKAELYNPMLNESYFNNIDSSDKAYFIGLLIADGNVYRIPKNDKSNRQDSISISLLEQDKYILEYFKNVLHANTSLVCDNRYKNNVFSIAIRSNIISNDLEKYGIIPNKTCKTFLPKISDIFMPDLIRGIFDGDGSIRAYKNTETNKFLKYFTICGTHRLIQDITNYLNSNLKLHTKLKVYDYKNKSLSEFKVNSYQDIITICNWMYKDANLYLKRKKEKFDLIVQNYNK